MFLASKVEEAPVLASDLCSILKADSEPVLISEYTLLDGLQFHLNVFQPQNSLKAVKYELGVSESIIYSSMILIQFIYRQEE